MLSFYTPRTVFKALIKQKYLPVIMGLTISNNLLPEPLVYMNKLTVWLHVSLTIFRVSELIKFFSLLQLWQASVSLLASFLRLFPAFLLVFVWFHIFSLIFYLFNCIFNFLKRTRIKNQIKKQIYFPILSIIMMS
jgi:hypothetical protein